MNHYQRERFVGVDELDGQIDAGDRIEQTAALYTGGGFEERQLFLQFRLDVGDLYPWLLLADLRDASLGGFGVWFNVHTSAQRRNASDPHPSPWDRVPQST